LFGNKKRKIGTQV